ncbi:FAD-dependent oxidoreductase [Desulfovirgula thermocuniculi]|uniref:FAD-dependent oxidoreductase n=1 Tax=Desulfovirgula thermocuniculi TaxID=348842 RepID=UPI00040964D1|nr:FAD-dependent oxidoreductase [Desulfovirgula thermocuniculi]
MGQKLLFSSTALLLAAVLLLAAGARLSPPDGEAARRYDIVVYGGSFAGCAAARTAASLASGRSVLLVVPGTLPALGGIGTVGGQNFFDVWYWRGGLTAGGSFARWFEEAGQFYHPGRMAAILRADLARYPNIHILWCYDVAEAVPSGGEGPLAELVLREVVPDSQGVPRWGRGAVRVRGRVYVDASEDGRLTRLAGDVTTTGRADWPQAYLEHGEGRTVAARQQAATLMFKVRGVRAPSPEAGRLVRAGDLVFFCDHRGSWGVAGGWKAYRENPVVRDFNRRYGPRGFALKPLNAAQEGPGSPEWWVNALLIFNVDGRATRRDAGTAAYPPDARPDALDADTARLLAKEVICDPKFLSALRQVGGTAADGKVYGFAGAELVRDERGEPVVGEVLYLRETVHLTREPREAGPGSEESAYALTPSACQGAGDGPGRGADGRHYGERVGLGFYAMDINAYTFEDLRAGGEYAWPVTGRVRPDWQQKGGEPQNPVYLPYRMLVTPRVPNLLVPGYATGASSLAWAEVRVIPNLCVLGDAAGAAAARAVLFNEEPARFGPEQISWVQEALKRLGGRLEK